MTDTTAAPGRLAKSYEPAEVEDRIYQWWERSGFFHAEPDDPGEPFVIVMPPPNVTGSLHIGHALTSAVEDAFVRYHRMLGDNTVWLPGMDHAGIATQTVVERQLAAEGLSRHDLGREAFVARVWDWKAESGGAILRQQRRLGASCDWDREAFTFDEQRSRAVREVFCSLYEEGLIYRGNRLINWDPVAGTALSDIEVDHETVAGELTYIRYPASDGGPGVVVATTRPETMLGDTAVAVHPDDERYRDLVGRTVRLPLMDRDIPVVADEHVDREFGTGAVKITPAHDFNDYEIGRRHDLEVVDVMTDGARINANGGPYEGLTRDEARTRVTADLQALGLVERSEPITHAVGVSSRSGEVLEPRLSDQWFVRMAPLAAEGLAAVRAGRTRLIPERATKPFVDWLENHHDWCISRQLWWGHRIPAWFDRDGGIHVYREDPPAEEVERLGLVQDEDVLDTWFSSQLWPFTTLGWPDDTPELRAWYPNTVLETGYDINAIWVSKMLMIGLHVMGDVPFGLVWNHGLVRDEVGRKMSKSLGNVIDPLDFIDRYGADALRYALLRAANPGQDVPLAEDWVEGGRRFANKLWNAARFVLARPGVSGGAELPPHNELRVEDRWILSRLEAVRAAADAAYAGYDVAEATQRVYAFIWDEFCDWYLELTKLRDDPAADRVLGVVLDQSLRLLHPIMPFITEELWRTLHDADERTALLRAAWPTPHPEHRDAEAEAGIGALQEAVTALRRFRATHGLAPARRLRVIAAAAGAAREALAAGVAGIQRLAGVGEWVFGDAPAGEPVGRVVLTGAELFVPLEGLIDVAGERRRLEGEIARAAGELERARRKLANEGFVVKAAPALVQAERDKLAQWETTRQQLGDQLRLLGGDA